MEKKFVSMRNLKFMLYEVFDAASLIQYPYYEEQSVEAFDMILETAVKIGGGKLRPFLEEMDKNPPPPALVAHEANNSQDPGYKELLDTVLARRRAERHQEGEPTESATDSGDPRTKISTEQLDAIKQAVANRSRGGGW